MNSYEGLFVVRSDLNEESAGNVFKAINSMIEKLGGKVKKEERWGKKQLAYRIKKMRDGHFYRIEFDIAPLSVVKLAAGYKLNADIVRAMITKA